MNEQFARDVMKGLSSNPKYLFSKYFYDKEGDALFRNIMAQDDYYLTRCEYQILQDEKDRLLGNFTPDGSHFDLIEFGAGDGLKTKVLLDHFHKQNASFTYMPVDISQNALDLLAADLHKALPELNITLLQGDYFKALTQLQHSDNHKKIVLFLGSNIGNFLKPVALDFLKKLSGILSRGDHLLLGVDLVKDPRIIAKAYNDSAGATKAFNLNLLKRINAELGGNFDIGTFQHYPFYNPVNGEARSSLVSMKRQTVSIDKLNASFHFRAWETISMELSQKYWISELEELATQTGFKIVRHYFDPREYFTDSLWEVN